MRYHSLDFLRGFSVAGMILFHMNYLLEHVFDQDIIPFGDSFWRVLGYLVAVIFISLAGILSVQRAHEKTDRDIMKKALRRTLILGGLALGISIMTYGFFPQERISW
jgi:uncharacterized membrane protein